MCISDGGSIFLEGDTESERLFDVSIGVGVPGIVPCGRVASLFAFGDREACSAELEVPRKAKSRMSELLLFWLSDILEAASFRLLCL